MGVDYYECDNCSVGFRDDSPYCVWCECGAKFHSVECGKLENYQVLEDIDEDDPRYEDYINGECRIDVNKPYTCLICRKEVIRDEELLDFLLKRGNLTREQAVELYRNGK